MFTVATQMPMAKSLKCYKSNMGEMKEKDCGDNATYCTNMTSKYFRSEKQVFNIKTV